MPRPKSIEWPGIARRAYEAYVKVRGLPNQPPMFHELRAREREAWIAAAKEVAERI